MDTTKKGIPDPKKGQALHPDKRLMDKCLALRNYVDTINRAPDIALGATGVYQTKRLANGYFATTRHDGMKLGYGVKPVQGLDGWFERVATVQILDGKFTELSGSELSVLTVSVISAFFDVGQGRVKDDMVGDDMIGFSQVFMPMVWTEKNPNLVVPGGHA